MNSKKGFIAMLAVLLSVLLLLGFRTYSLSAEKAAMAHKSRMLEEEVRDFGILKTYLMEQVDSLQKSYDALVMENATLQGPSEEASRRLAEKAAIIKKLKSKDASSKEVKTLKSTIEDLLELKASLINEIADLRTENTNLKAQNNPLSTDLATASSENEALASFRLQ